MQTSLHRRLHRGAVSCLRGLVRLSAQEAGWRGHDADIPVTGACTVVQSAAPGALASYLATPLSFMCA